MKKLLCLLLIPVLCMTLFACKEEPPKLQSPVNFYYLRQEPTYGAADSLIASLPSEGAGYADDTLRLLNVYLCGPNSDEFRSPFPWDAKVLEFSVSENLAHIQLNEAFSRLSGIDLTVACACLTMTVMDLTGAQTVQLCAKDSTLDGAPHIIMDRDCMTMVDNYTPEST